MTFTEEQAQRLKILGFGALVDGKPPVEIEEAPAMHLEHACGTPVQFLGHEQPRGMSFLIAKHFCPKCNLTFTGSSAELIWKETP